MLSVPTEAEWQASVANLMPLNARLRERIRGLGAALDADAPLVREPAYSAVTQIIGTTPHDLHHAGQIALLKRALGVK